MAGHNCGVYCPLEMRRACIAAIHAGQGRAITRLPSRADEFRAEAVAEHLKRQCANMLLQAASAALSVAFGSILGGFLLEVITLLV